MALGALNVVTGNFVGGMWWFLIGLFLHSAATASGAVAVKGEGFPSWCTVIFDTSPIEHLE
jgi:hypothetical protein